MNPISFISSLASSFVWGWYFFGGEGGKNECQKAYLKGKVNVLLKLNFKNKNKGHQSEVLQE